MGGRLPFGLPHQLETLEYIARRAAPHELYGSREEAAAAEVIARLGSLLQLTVRHWTYMPLSFVSALPSTLQVALRSIHICVYDACKLCSSVILVILLAGSTARGSVHARSVWAVAAMVAFAIRLADKSSLACPVVTC